MAAFTFYDIAGLIPAKYRRKLLEENVIYKAAAQQEDPHMQVLWVVWTTFIDSSGALSKDCLYCLTTILENFKELEPHLVQRHKEDTMLDEI